jgi:hypothetical protein
VPAAGDIVVRRERADGTTIFVVCVVPGAARYVASMRGDAMLKGRDPARRSRVRLFVCDGNHLDVDREVRG